MPHLSSFSALFPSALRCTFLFLISALAVGVARAQESVASEKAAPAERNISLSIGDPAPKLQVDDWITGEAVTDYSAEHFYVVEFWATWCVPCIQSMPHLSELAEQYEDKGLIVVALTNDGPSNSLDKVEKFAAGKGKEFKFRYAFSQSQANMQAFMDAAGQKGIPCSFVIDRKGCIAYIGRPTDLDYVLSRLAEGKWRGKADADELEQMNQSIAGLAKMASEDPEKALGVIQHIESVNPKRAESVDFAYAKIITLCAIKNFDAAKATLDSYKPIFAKSEGWGMLAMICGSLASQEINPEGIHRDYAMKSLREIREAAKEDWQSLLQVALGFRIAGDSKLFSECFEQAMDGCPEGATKTALKQQFEMLR